jgi:hypothetical protein
MLTPHYCLTPKASTYPVRRPPHTSVSCAPKLTHIFSSSVMLKKPREGKGAASFIRKKLPASGFGSAPKKQKTVPAQTESGSVFCLVSQSLPRPCGSLIACKLGATFMFPLFLSLAVFLGHPLPACLCSCIMGSSEERYIPVLSRGTPVFLKTSQRIPVGKIFFLQPSSVSLFPCSYQ